MSESHWMAPLPPTLKHDDGCFLGADTRIREKVSAVDANRKEWGGFRVHHEDAAHPPSMTGGSLRHCGTIRRDWIDSRGSCPECRRCGSSLLLLRLLLQRGGCRSDDIPVLLLRMSRIGCMTCNETWRV
jgi:hypothetical protein